MSREPKRIIFYDASNLGKLHCDACGYNLPERSAFTPALIGTPCPKCGADMLTRRDYESTRKGLRLIDLLNRLLGPIFGRREAPQSAETIQVCIHDDSLTINRKRD